MKRGVTDLSNVPLIRLNFIHLLFLFFYDNVDFKLPFDDFDKKHRVKCIVCFCISPNARGKGVATSMLEKICADATAEGYDYIEACPFDNDENNAYHGPRSMYVKYGFEKTNVLMGALFSENPYK